VLRATSGVECQYRTSESVGPGPAFLLSPVVANQRSLDRSWRVAERVDLCLLSCSAAFNNCLPRVGYFLFCVCTELGNPVRVWEYISVLCTAQMSRTMEVVQINDKNGHDME
jgi:hypothetical protein